MKLSDSVRVRRSKGNAMASSLLTVEPYLARDSNDVLAVFDSNVPHAFAQTERSRFEAFLSAPPGPAWIGRLGGVLVGFGGLSFSDDSTAWLRWGMVRSGSQR